MKIVKIESNQPERPSRLKPPFLRPSLPPPSLLVVLIPIHGWDEERQDSSVLLVFTCQSERAKKRREKGRGRGVRKRATRRRRDLGSIEGPASYELRALARRQSHREEDRGPRMGERLTDVEVHDQRVAFADTCTEPRTREKERKIKSKREGEGRELPLFASLGNAEEERERSKSKSTDKRPSNP